MDIQKFSTSFIKSKALLGAILAIFVLKISMSLLFISFPGNIFFADITKSTLLNMLNQTRNSMGINALSENNLLDQAAQLKAQDMVENEYFNHISPTGTTPWYWFLKAGYNYKYAGENLAIGFYDSKEVFDAWMNSATHKKNMLNSAYTEVGTAVLSGFGQNNAIVVVQLFGAPNKAKVSANNTTEPKPEIKEEVVTEKETATKTEIQTEKVLSSTDFIQADKNTGVNDMYHRFLNFVIYSHDIFLQYIIYGLLAIIIMMMTYILSFNFNKQINSGLVLRSLILIGILISAALINTDLIMSIIPNQIII